MKTFKEWFQSGHGVAYAGMYVFAEAAWNASAENAQAEIAKRDARIAELEQQCRTNHSMELDAMAREHDELAAQNQQLRARLEYAKGYAEEYGLLNLVEDIAQELSLPDLASRVLNRGKAEAIRHVAQNFQFQGAKTSVCYDLERMADAIEKGEG